MQTTDDQVVTVNFHEPIDSSLDGWVEVHGLAKDKGTVAGESYYNLPSSITDDFGKYTIHEWLSHHKLKNIIFIKPPKALNNCVGGGHGKNLNFGAW